MKLFIIRALIFLIPFGITGMSLELLLQNIPNDYSYKKKFLDQNSHKIENLFLGNSHTYYGINPELISGMSFNASHISQSIDIDYSILMKYHDSWGSLRNIVIPIDYFSLFSTLSKDVDYWRLKNYNLYYDLELSNSLADNSEVLSFNFKSNLKRVYKFYYKNESTITCSSLGYGKQAIPIQGYVESGIKAAQRHSKSNFDLYNNNLVTIENIISFASSQNIRIIFYSSPAYKSYISNLEKEQLDLTINTITKIANENNNCSYTNYLGDNDFKLSDFRDSDHLSNSGAKKLSLKLSKLITSN